MAQGGFFTRVGPHTVRPTEHTAGAWNVDEQHIAATNGLVVHELDRWVAERGAPPMLLARLTVEILGVLTMADMDVALEVVRPGRTIELCEVTVSQHDRAVVRARAWRLATRDTREVAGGAPEPLPSPEGLEPFSFSSVWPGGFIEGVEMRPVHGPTPGRTTAWMRTPIAIVEGESSSPTARFVLMVDTANGIAIREPIDAWLYPNVDLTIHLHREPVRGWVGLDTSVVFGGDGIGLTSSVLHDEAGAVGRAEQCLTIRNRRG